MAHLLKKVSNLPFAFGGASISGEGAGYGFGEIKENEALELLLYAKERGVQIFDTAPIYGFGLSEKRMGLAFRNCREDVFIISKSGVSWHENKRVDMTNDPEVTKKMLEQSLRNLNSDYIDLFMIHWPDKNVDIRKPLEVLAKAKMEGKIKHIGLANTFLEDLEKAREIDQIEVVQNEFNFFKRDLSETLFPYLHSNKISFMSWGTLEKGILTGRVHRKRTFKKSDCRSWAPWWKQMDKESYYKKMDKLFPYLKDHNCSGLEFAIGHNLFFKEVDVVLCGARDKIQLDGVLNALDKKIDANFIDEAVKIVS